MLANGLRQSNSLPAPIEDPMESSISCIELRLWTDLSFGVFYYWVEATLHHPYFTLNLLFFLLGSYVPVDLPPTCPTSAPLLRTTSPDPSALSLHPSFSQNLPQSTTGLHPQPCLIVPMLTLTAMS